MAGWPRWVALDPTGAAKPEEVLPREVPPREPLVPRHTGRLPSEPTCVTPPLDSLNVGDFSEIAETTGQADTV